MITGEKGSRPGDILPLRAPREIMAVSDELGRLTSMLREVCPTEAVISFDYNGALHLHVDVRLIEDVTKIEALLPSLCGGIFHSAQRRMTARHSFFRRVSFSVSL